jgi:hypothetical protein
MSSRTQDRRVAPADGSFEEVRLFGDLLLAQADSAHAFDTWATAAWADKAGAFATYRDTLDREEALQWLLLERLTRD